MLESDQTAGATGHMLQLLYACRLLKPSAGLQESSGMAALLESLVSSGNAALAEEARAVQALWKRGRKRGRKEEEGAKTRGKRARTGGVSPVLSDDVSFEPPIGEEKAERVRVSIRVRSWGIKYHERDCFVYALLRALAEKGEFLLYDRVLGDIWNDNRSKEVLLVEEDFIAEYPFLKRELRGLDRMRGFPLNVNTFSVNEFMETLGWKHECWKRNLGNADYAFLLEEELEIAYYRGGLLEADEKVEEAVERGELPAQRGCVCPEPAACELSAADWK